MFDSFYFFHIDKTIGKTMGIHMMDPLYPIMDDYGISATTLNLTHQHHNKWKNFNENTYIYCTIRDPLERFIADFLNTVNYTNDGYRKWSGGKDISSPFATIEKLKDFMNMSDKFNYHAKIISDGTFDISLIDKRLSRINLLIKTEDLKNNEMNIQNKILSDIGIEYNLNKFNPDYEISFYDETVRDFIHIFLNGTKLLDEIIEKNSIDYKIYNSIRPEDSTAEPMNLKNGGVARGCGKIMSDRKKVTKYF